MKKFIKNTFIFLIPALLIYCFTLFFYSTDKGELLRIGYVIDISFNYLQKFEKETQRTNNVFEVSEINKNKKKKYDVFTIGDSFSNQGTSSYQNYLVEKGKMDLLNFDGYLHKNPIQTLYSLLESDFFDEIAVKYVILQSVERQFVSRVNIDTSVVINYKELCNSAEEISMSLKEPDYKDRFPSNRQIKFCTYSLLYLFDDNAFYSQVYKTKTNGNLFSINKNELLFYYEDIDALSKNNEINNIMKLNNLLNYLSDELEKKNIKLIVLPCPDKYDLYYDYITDKKSYLKPLFFNHLNNMKKNYMYVDSKQILSKAMKNNKDVYYYDGTHWSPIGAKIIANELSEIIK